ncbi:MAG: hypothetical protein V1799_06455 [bacterium]
MKQLLIIVPMVLFFLSCNPFAPALDESDQEGSSILGDPKTIEGIFQQMKYAYTFKDTTIYGQLLASDFIFVYRDYERAVDVTWGRDQEMLTAYRMFQNVQRLDLVWNNMFSFSVDSTSTQAFISRNFNLTVTFNPSDILRVDGYASFVFARHSADESWRILRWKDESNF